MTASELPMRIAGICGLLITLLGNVCFAQGVAKTETYEGALAFETLVQKWNLELNDIEAQLSNRTIDNEQIGAFTISVREIRESATKKRAKASEIVATQRDLLSAVADAPPEGEFEDATIAKQREMMQRRLAHYEGRVQRCDLILARAETVLADMAQAGYKSLVKRLTLQGPIPLSPVVIRDAVKQFPWAAKQTLDSISLYWKRLVAGEGLPKRYPATLTLFLIALVMFTLGFRASRRYLAFETPTLPQKLLRTVFTIAYRAVAPVFAVMAVFALLSVARSNLNVQNIGFALIISAVQIFIALGISYAILSPKRPLWRVSEFSNSAAKSLYQSIVLFALVSLIANLIVAVVNEDTNPPELVTVASFGIAIMAVIAIFGLVRTKNWCFSRTVDGEQIARPPQRSTRLFMRAVQIVVIVGLLAAILGYRHLSRYLIYDTGWTLILLGFALVLRTLAATSLNQLVEPNSRVGSWLSSVFVTNAAGVSKIVFWVLLLIDIFLVLALTVLLLLLWGFSIAEMDRFAVKYLSGVSIGDWKFSFVDLGTAIIVFVGVLFFFRFITKVLFQRIFVHTGFDVGVRDALTTGLGYLGIVLASLIGFSVLGVNFDKIAIIVGALSVGIGFGLQTVVGNFVSGLILLVQRPIKSGDWIVVGQHQGYVKRVKSTTTEIQTFDNASVLVPNNTLVSTEVVNWTHKSKLGRVIIPVHVSYDSDPNEVREILQNLSRENTSILARPEPQVMFMNFGPSSLEFELRCFIAEIDYSVLVASDMRFAIKSAFDSAGIKIPYPQQDLHIKSMMPGFDPNTFNQGSSSA